MKHHTLLGRMLTVACLAASATSALAQTPRPNTPAPFGGSPSPSGAFPWWKMAQSRKELGLTTDQSARLDKIWETTRPELRVEWDALTRLEEQFSRLIQNDADEAVLSRQIDRVETERANANKTRSLMLVQMMKVLTPEQRTKLAAMHERYFQELPTPPPPAASAPKAHKQD
jgi:Spy/CpxP family protein refolding chaperone